MTTTGTLYLDGVEFGSVSDLRLDLASDTDYTGELRFDGKSVLVIEIDGVQHYFASANTSGVMRSNHGAALTNFGELKLMEHDEAREKFDRELNMMSGISNISLRGLTPEVIQQEFQKIFDAHGEQLAAQKKPAKFGGDKPYLKRKKGRG